jgi:hypothetical protein
MPTRAKCWWWVAILIFPARVGAQPSEIPPAIDDAQALQMLGVNRETDSASCTQAPAPAASEEQPPATLPAEEGRDKRVIRAVIRSHLAEVTSCYEAGLTQPPYPAGRLATRFAIGPSGNVIGSCVVTSALNHPEIERCVVDAMLGWEFPKPLGGGHVVVTYPFVMTPEEPPLEPTAAAPPAATGVVPTADGASQMENPPGMERAQARRPVWTLALVMGVAGKGDELITAHLTDGSSETLYAGSGFSILGAVSRGVFGSGRHAVLLGLEGGVKGWNIGGDSNYYVSLVRYPLIPHVRYLYGVSPGTRLLTSFGANYEIDVEMRGEGLAEMFDLQFNPALGWMAEAGFVSEAQRGGGGATLTVRYTRLAYRAPGLRGSINASNIGVFLGGQWSTFESPR